MFDIFTQRHVERRLRIIIASITIALAAQIFISVITDGFILTLSLFILPVFLYFNDDVNPFHICLGIAFASPIFRGVILMLVGESSFLLILKFIFTDMAFYLCYGFCFYSLYWCRSYRNKGSFFLTIIICDYFSNILEISLLLNFQHYTVKIFQFLFLTALLRAFVSCALAYIYNYLTLLILKDYHEKRYYYFIWSTSAVKSEVYFMQKNIYEIENVMKNAYLLDKELEKYHLPQEFQHLSLAIARDVHEVKKDYQNVIKGLGTYFKVESGSSLLLKDIFRIVLSYIRSLIQAYQQDIIITEKIQSKLAVSNYYLLLNVISNLVLNAVEAIGDQKKGTIVVSVEETDKMLRIMISDNGPGISGKMKEYIFQAGFSTKFDANGDIYRGIGLSNVKVIVEEQFNGSISCSDNIPKGTIFTIDLCKEKLMNGVGE